MKHMNKDYLVDWIMWLHFFFFFFDPAKVTLLRQISHVPHSLLSKQCSNCVRSTEIASQSWRLSTHGLTDILIGMSCRCVTTR